MPLRLPVYEDIVAAAKRIAGHAEVTPLVESALLNARVGGRVLLKCENLQRVGAFKFRGAYNKISQLDPKQNAGGVVALSSGNHAQGVAEAARLAGLKAMIIMPADAPAMKVARTRRSGAEVRLFDRDKEDREALARRVTEERGAVLVHPFDDPDVMAGQGTAGVELMAQAKARGLVPDAVLVPVSGGGLLAGIALAVKHHAPKAEVWSVEPVDFDDFARSLKSGKRERNARTSGSISDSLLVTSPGEATLAVCRPLVAGGLAISDEEAGRAVKFAFEELKLVVEPGGAVGLAAVLSGAIATKGRVIAIVLSGGNVDPALFAKLIA